MSYEIIEELHPRHKGKEFECRFKGAVIKGKIQYENGEFYLCQKLYDGKDARDKLGYSYSWCVGRGSKSDLSYHGLINLKISESEWDPGENR